MVGVKIILIAVFGMVFIQDIKARQINWIWIPIISLCAGLLLYNHSPTGMFFITVLTNSIFVLFLLLVIFIYATYKLKLPASKTFALGDALLLFALAFSFSTLSFIVLLVFGFIASLITHIFLNRTSASKTVPLAGYLSLFFAIAYLAHWFGILTPLYIF